MSVLFEALSKASREYRPVDDPVVIPVVPLRAARSFAPPLYAVSLLIAALLGGVIVYLARDPAPKPVPVVPAPVATALAPAATDEQAEGIVLSTQAPNDMEDSEGVPSTLVMPTVSEDEAKASKGRIALSLPSPVVLETIDPLQPTVQIADDLRRAAQAMQLQAWGAALMLFDKVLTRKPDQAQALDGKIFVLEQIGNAEALAQIDMLVKTYPAKASLRAAQARLLSAAGREVEAMAAWEQAVALEPSNTSYTLGVAISHDRLGHVDQALSGYRATPASELTPQIRRRVAYLEEQMRQYEAVLAASDVGGGKD